jgi:hypothetical protein
MIHTAPISSRNELGRLLCERGLTERMAEVGTHRGDFARILLASWPGELHCVDHWAVPPGYEAQAEYLRRDVGGAIDREDDLRACKEALAQFGARAQFWRRASACVVGRFPFYSLDCVYLDADHSYDGVCDDLRTWWPTVRVGGILAGHDFVCPGPIDRPDNWGRAVQAAVLRFAEAHGLDVLVVAEEQNLPWSYLIEKPS